MTTILSVDPGLITGLSWGYYDDKTPYELTNVAALEFDRLSDDIWGGFEWGDVLVIERFIPQSGGNFTLKEDDLVGVQVMGMLRHAHTANEVYWRTRGQKVIAGSLKESDQILKDHGLWQKGKDVDWTDGRDCNDSILHALGFLKDRDHEPTLREYFHN